MTNLHAQHSKGWAGLAFVVLLIVSVFAGGVPPAANADANTISGYLNAHRQGVLVEAWLTLPLSAFFLWFSVGLSGFLRRTSARDDGLPTYVLVAGTFTVAAAWVGAVLLCALAAVPLGSGGLSFIWALSTYMNGPFLSMATAIFAYAAAHSMRRHGSGPGWLVWLGYLAAAAQVVETFGLFAPSGLPADNAILSLITLALLAIWLIAASLHLITATGGREESGIPSPA